MSTTCTVKLLNKTYDIKCPIGEETNLQLAADKLNSHLAANKKKVKGLDDFQQLLLAALHVSHELVTCKIQHEKQREHVTKFIHSFEEGTIYSAFLENETD